MHKVDVVVHKVEGGRTLVEDTATQCVGRSSGLSEAVSSKCLHDMGPLERQPMKYNDSTVNNRLHKEEGKRKKKKKKKRKKEKGKKRKEKKETEGWKVTQMSKKGNHVMGG